MNSRYNSIKDFDINQSNGVSVSLWFQGCEHKCEGCHNPDTWDFNKGTPFTNETIDLILYLLGKDNIQKNLSVLGGEPFSPRNLKLLSELLKKVKLLNKNIEVWVWTGYNFEELNTPSILENIDVLIDGKYDKSLHDVSRYKGSSNQRVIDVQETLKNNKIILYK